MVLASRNKSLIEKFDEVKNDYGERIDVYGFVEAIEEIISDYNEDM